MNLLIEQRPTTITSNLQPQSHVSSTQNEVNASSSPLVLKLKRHTANQQENDLRSTSSSSSSSAMDNDDDSHSHARSTPTNQRLKRITTTTATRRSTSPAFNGKQQASKRSVTIDSNNNDLTAQTDEISASSKRFKSDEFNVSFSVRVFIYFPLTHQSHRKYPPLSLARSMHNVCLLCFVFSSSHQLKSMPAWKLCPSAWPPSPIISVPASP